MWHIATLFPDKSTHKKEIEGNYFNIIKTKYEKFTGSIIHKGERMKAFPLKSRTRCLLLPLPFNKLLEALARPNKQGKGIKESKLERSKMISVQKLHYLTCTKS